MEVSYYGIYYYYYYLISTIELYPFLHNIQSCLIKIDDRKTPESTLRVFLRDIQKELEEMPLFGLPPAMMNPAEIAVIKMRTDEAIAQVAAVVQQAEEKMQRRKDALDGKEILTGARPDRYSSVCCCFFCKYFTLIYFNRWSPRN